MKIKIIFCFTVFFFLFAAPLLAAQATITLVAPTGKVYKTATDINGNFNLDVPNAAYTVTVSAPGYQKLTFKWSPDQGKDYFTKIKLVKAGQTEKGNFEIDEAGSLRLLEGWNLITLDVVPASSLLAADLTRMINQQGGLVGAVSRWADSRWQTYLPVSLLSGPGLEQNNFEITPGAAYFVQALKPSRFKFEGAPLTQPLKLSLAPGWNSVGLPLTANCLNCTGRKLLTLHDSLLSVSFFDSGLWQTVAKDGEQAYGLDFPLEAQRGCFLKAGQAVTLEP